MPVGVLTSGRVGRTAAVPARTQRRSGAMAATCAIVVAFGTPVAWSGPVHSYLDVLGHRYFWSTPPQRIVSLSPNLTEILFAIDCDSTRVVGVTRFCDYPPAAARVDRVGGIVDPSLEAIVALNPDLVLATRGNPLEFIESVRRLGIPVYALEDRGGLPQIFKIIREIGAVTGRAGQGDSLAEALEQRVSEVARRTQSLSGDDRPRVYYGELEGAHWTAGPGSYIDDLIAAAGGRNVASIAPSAWSTLALEAIVMRNPQVYLGTFAGADTPQRRDAAQARAIDLVRTREGWSKTDLGTAPRAFLVQEDRLSRPGPRMVDVLEEFARFLHPDLAPAGR